MADEAEQIGNCDVIYLFAYGTLRRDEPGHELMKDATFISTVLKAGLKWISETDYPTCIETEDAGELPVVGEIWAVPVADLPLLDDYEGVNYKRVQLKNSNLYAYVLKEDEQEKFAAIT